MELVNHILACAPPETALIANHDRRYYMDAGRFEAELVEKITREKAAQGGEEEEEVDAEMPQWAGKVLRLPQQKAWHGCGAFQSGSGRGNPDRKRGEYRIPERAAPAPLRTSDFLD
jgi:catalase (peroxidase I)